MNIGNWLRLFALCLPLAIAGCKDAATGRPNAADADKSKVPGKSAEGEDDEAEIRSALAKLNPDDRQLAETQRFCVVMNDSRLGSMGTPIKVTVKDQPVFVCCKGCVKKALKDPEKTLTKAAELKAKTPESPAK